MPEVTDAQIREYVADNIGTFHENRLAKLNALQLDELLGSKNPYLFKSKNIVTAPELVGAMLDAYLSSQEEGLFGVFLEGLAIFVASETVGGQKSSTTGIDLEFTRDGARYIVSIKSGPNWGNSSQVKKMKDNFREASRVLRQGNRTMNIIAVNGCCYGRDSSPDKGDYRKICGQEFWELISNDREFYTRIIEPLAHDAKQQNDAFRENYVRVVNRFCGAFIKDYCFGNGAINWPKLVALSSAITPLIDRPARKFYINRLDNLTGVCDTLRNWDAADLAARIEYLTSDQSEDDKTEIPNLESLRGFLMVWSAIESEGKIGLSFDKDDLLCANWQFPDRRSLEVKFLDVDRITLTATDTNGQTVKIRNSQTAVRRDTALKGLIESGLLTRFEAD